jgi:iron(III) transport system ATP-binding protein
MATGISIRGLSKSYPSLGGGGGVCTVVCGVDLEIKAGELFFLLGPSGCGKTTLLRMIAGFIDPTAGAIFFDGREVTFTPPNKRNTGMVFQSYALWPHMSVEANVGFGLSIRKTPAGEARRRVSEALALVQMEGYASRRPTQLSGGQQQRVALARAIVIRPDVLLLDEPLSNLDAKLRLELRSEIKRICSSSGITTVYVTHDQKEALSMADRIAVMRSGRIEQVAPPPEMYHRPNSRFVAEFLGETNILPGVVASCEGGRATLVLGSRPVHAVAPVALSAGSSASVSIRPEAITLESAGGAAPGEGGGSCRVPGTVVDSLFLGELTQYRVRIEGAGEIQVFALGSLAHLANGTSVHAVIPAAHAVALAN